MVENVNEGSEIDVNGVVNAPIVDEIIELEGGSATIIEEPVAMQIDKRIGVSSAKVTKQKDPAKIAQPKELGKIVLLKNIAGMKSGSIIDIMNIDKSGGVHFIIGDTKTYFSTLEKGKLWKFDGEK